METVHQKTKKKPTKVEEMTKEQIRQAIVKKRECNAKAQQIVESLLERNVTDKYLLQCLPDINQAHLDDIFEERSIIHLCGYPICQKTLCIKDIPKQKYRISLKTNKVYDITARKNFCSNTCYNAAMYVKKQLLTSPLWFREYEVIPTFHLLNTDTLGGIGEEIDVTIVDRIKILDKKSFTSINDFTQASLVDVPDDALNLEGDPVPTSDNPSVAEDPTTKAHDKSSNKSMPQSSSQQEHTKDVEGLAEEIKDISITKCKNLKNDNITTISNVDENITKLATQDKINTSLKETATNKGTDKVARNTNRNHLNIIGEIIEKPEKKVDPILMATPAPNAPVEKKDFKKSKLLQKKQPMVTALTIEVEKCLAEWFTLDTMLLLFGDERVREMVADKGECIKEYLNNYSKGIFYSSNTYDQYQVLCKKLNMLELEDRKFDSESKQDLRPLPNYSMLQEESKKMQLKVNAFLSGATDIPEPAIEETMQPISDEEKTTILPLLDKNSQNALRRKIVCQYLNKVLPDLLRSLGLLSLQINADVRLLVNTFKLKANNIMFKPIQWTLIAIIFIKLLSIRDKRLEYLLEQPTAYNHMQLLLLSYKQDGGYLDRLICWLTDIDRLLDTDDTQLTIE